MRVAMVALLSLGALLFTAACQKPDTKPVVPEVFRVKFQTSQGDFIVEASRAWAPRGADRFHELVNMRYFDEGRFFRVVKGFIAQFGVHRDFDVPASGAIFSFLTTRPRRRTCAARWPSPSPAPTPARPKSSSTLPAIPCWMRRD
jgi:hypothetical protein